VKAGPDLRSAPGAQRVEMTGERGTGTEKRRKN